MILSLLSWPACVPLSSPNASDSQSSSGEAPFVSTLVEVAGSDDATWHPDGFLLVSDLIGEGSWPEQPIGDEILAVDVSTGAVSVWGTGVPQPIGATLTGDGAMVVAAYGASAGVWVIPPGGGAGSLLVDGLAYPSMVALDDEGSLLVTEWSRNQISRIVDGVAEPFAEVPGPVGIDRRADGTLIVGGRQGWIYTLDSDGTATPWVQLPEGEPSDFAAIGERTYVTSFEGHRVWQIDAAGEVSLLVGTGVPGNQDGALDEALLTAPNGIAASAAGDALYVQQLDRRLRVIHLR